MNETYKPRIPEVAYEKLGAYLPRLTQAEGLFAEREASNSREVASIAKGCSNEPKDLQKDLKGLMSLANACVAGKKYSMVDKIAQKLAETSPESGIAPYYLSLVASGLGQKEKAAYLIDLALKKSANKTFFVYQRALTSGMNGERAQANQGMIKAFDEKLDAWETKLLHGVVAFSQGDCFSVTDDFKTLPAGTTEQFQLLPALSECMAQKGEVDPAIALVQSETTKQKSLSLALQWGHLAEVYKMDPKMAVTAYEKAASFTTDAATKEWLSNKIKWINNPQTVSESDSSHVSTQVAKKETYGDRQ